jgi:acylphosphatase
MNCNRCVRVIITGIVQGVGYRWRAREAALSLGITGWIKNRPDGSVEAVFQGPPGPLEEMIKWAWSGPPGAAVREVATTSCRYEPEMKGFVITEENQNN